MMRRWLPLVLLLSCESPEETAIAEDEPLGSEDISYDGGHAISTICDDPEVLRIEEEVFALVNDHRVSIGQNALIMHEGLRRCARGHSRHMIQHDFFAHVNPEGDGPGERFSLCGIGYRAGGENIAAGFRSSRDAFEAWMNSPGHKENIERVGWTHTGVGYWAGGGTYGTYYSQEFLTK